MSRGQSVWQGFPATLHLCHSERSEESSLLRGEILRCAQDDGRRTCQEDLPHTGQMLTVGVELSGREDDWGGKGESGNLETVATRRAFLRFIEG